MVSKNLSSTLSENLLYCKYLYIARSYTRPKSSFGKKGPGPIGAIHNQGIVSRKVGSQPACLGSEPYSAINLVVDTGQVIDPYPISVFSSVTYKEMIIHLRMKKVNVCKEFRKCSPHNQ